jgi:hypothetical protein
MSKNRVALLCCLSALIASATTYLACRPDELKGQSQFPFPSLFHPTLPQAVEGIQLSGSPNSMDPAVSVNVRLSLDPSDLAVLADALRRPR